MCAHSRFDPCASPAAAPRHALERADIGLCPLRSASMSDPLSTIARMKADQQELPFRQWGGARKGAGRKRQSARPNVPHRTRQGFRKGALHVTLRMRREVWNLRTHRCFRALRWAFARGCERFGFRLGGVLGAGQSHSLHRRGARRADAGPRDEGPRGPDGARAQQGDAPHRAGIRRSLPRAPSNFAAGGRERDPVRARELDRPC